MDTLPQLTIDLDRDLDLVCTGKLLVIFGKSSVVRENAILVPYQNGKQFLSRVRSKWREHQGESSQGFANREFVFVRGRIRFDAKVADRIGQLHQSRNRRVKLQAFETVRDAFDRLMGFLAEFTRRPLVRQVVSRSTLQANSLKF